MVHEDIFSIKGAIVAETIKILMININSLLIEGERLQELVDEIMLK